MLYIDKLLFGSESEENLGQGPRIESKREVEQPERWVVKNLNVNQRLTFDNSFSD